jgi:dimethylamine monooxygenase subunit C
MLVTGIKSKPVYAPLRADLGGRYHLMLGMGPGADALLRVLAEIQGSALPALQKTRVLLVPDAGGTPTAVPFDHLGLGLVSQFAGAASLLEEFRLVLAESLMGTRLYVAGPESFIGLAMKIALEFDLNKDEIRAEEVGTLARRVYCVHCRSTTENVRTNIVSCTGCARWLLVRDHYSRRLAAYMGVMVDAEAPGELPQVKEAYL